MGLSKSFLKRHNAETILEHIEYVLRRHKELKTCPLAHFSYFPGVTRSWLTDPW